MIVDGCGLTVMAIGRCSIPDLLFADYILSEEGLEVIGKKDRGSGSISRAVALEFGLVAKRFGSVC